MEKEDNDKEYPCKSYVSFSCVLGFVAVGASRLQQASVADRQSLVGKGLPLC